VTEGGVEDREMIGAAMADVGRVERIWIKRAKGGPMDAVPRARALAGRGLVGNADQGGRRQVTIIEQDAWDRLRAEVDARIEPVMRRANVLVSGITLRETRGRVLQLGHLRVRVLGETRPCEQMDAAVPGLRRALEPEWRGGVFGEVLDEGDLSVGDLARWAEDQPAG
jgi:MOSC domain-containing protein YiiM